MAWRRAARSSRRHAIKDEAEIDRVRSVKRYAVRAEGRGRAALQVTASEQSVVIAREKGKEDITALEEASRRRSNSVESFPLNLHKEDITEVKNFVRAAGVGPATASFPRRVVQDACLMVVCL